MHGANCEGEGSAPVLVVLHACMGANCEGEGSAISASSVACMYMGANCEGGGPAISAGGVYTLLAESQYRQHSHLPSLGVKGFFLFSVFSDFKE